ncbi:cytochrome P450 oxidoreductase [Penicillium capsulatum]|uniref:Cytochrome P450 oxidoreductase n=1 Tax=Penicillium capsulatum TaxID=69766 RepID=A0A9W9LXA4_9EURO|nr:cytochrome P450 oxidoreductase [Penicillium capsulatum]
MLRSLLAVPILPALSGIGAHVFLYRHGEWDLATPLLVASYALVSLTLIALERFQTLCLLGLDPAPGWALGWITYHILGVYGSMLFYRGALHRLRRFPGPFCARLSNLYATSLSFKNLRLYEELDKLHSEYGDYVRIGPTELSIRDPAGVKPIYKAQAKTTKGPWYHCLEPRISVQTTRDKAEHARRRRVWDQGFSSSALREYEPRVSHFAAQLLKAIENSVGRPMDMTRWSNYYGFDIMGDMAFGQSFEMLVTGEDAYFLNQMHSDMKSIGLFTHVMWLFPLMKRIPILNNGYMQFWKSLNSRLQKRIQVRLQGPVAPDLRCTVTGPPAQNPLSTETDSLSSDTSSATFTNALFHLAKNPSLAKELQFQLATLPDLSNDQLARIDLLDALIYETLRLHPVIPSGLQRMTPPEGIMIGKKYIPGDVMVRIPMHTLFREEFIPERWTTRPELVKDASAWMPFGGGPYACVGKQFALMEIRRVIADILVRYDISFAPTQTEAAFLGGQKDTFTLVAAPLDLIFNERV